MFKVQGLEFSRMFDRFGFLRFLLHFMRGLMEITLRGARLNLAIANVSLSDKFSSTSITHLPKL